MQVITDMEAARDKNVFIARKEKSDSVRTIWEAKNVVAFNNKFPTTASFLNCCTGLWTGLV